MIKAVRAAIGNDFMSSHAFHVMSDANPTFDAPRNLDGPMPFVEVSESGLGGVWVSIEGADTFLNPDAPTTRVNALVPKADALRLAAGLLVASGGSARDLLDVLSDMAEKR